MQPTPQYGTVNHYTLAWPNPHSLFDEEVGKSSEDTDGTSTYGTVLLGAPFLNLLMLNPYLEREKKQPWHHGERNYN